VKALLILVVATVSAAYAQPATSGLQISPGSVNFGEDAIDSDVVTKTVIVRNPTSSPIAIDEVIASGIDFRVKSDCGQTLAPAAQCTIQVFFSPAISGPRTGNLEIMASGSPHFVALNGSGTYQKAQ
jgi:hypothetical protein